MHIFHNSAFLQTLAKGIAHNSQRCDVKHEGYQGKPGREREIPASLPHKTRKKKNGKQTSMEGATNLQVHMVRKKKFT